LKPRIPVASPLLTQREAELVASCVRSGWVSSRGSFITEFEERFAAFCDRRFGVATSNGTTALHLVLAALGVGPGDEVVVPALTFVATANAVTYTGAKAVFADCDPETWCMTPEAVECAITPATKGIIVVHLYGQPAPMEQILAVAAEHGLWVVEDAAQAHGAELLVDGKWRKAGALGVASCFSFYGNKIITTGEGGMLVTDDPELAARARRLRDHVMDAGKTYWHAEVGYNYRLTNLQAALGVAQLERIEQIIARKREIARRYRRELAELPGLAHSPAPADTEPVYWMYSLVVGEGFPRGRDDLRRFLAGRGVDTRPFFHPLHTLPPYRREGVRLPVCEELAARGLNLPSGPDISEDEIDYVCRAVREAARS